MIFQLAPWADRFVSTIDNAGIAAAESLRGYGMSAAEQAASGASAAIPHAGMTEFMKVVSELFDPMVVLIVACLIVAFFMLKKMRFQATRFLVSIVTISAFVWVAKHIVVRARPAGSLIAETGFSFPSGHAAVSLVFFALIYMSFASLVPERYRALRWIFLAIVIIMPMLIGFSRVYLGVHYLSDVLAGFIFGAIIVALARLFSEKYKQRQVKA